VGKQISSGAFCFDSAFSTHLDQTFVGTWVQASNRQGSGCAARALALGAARFGVAVVSEPLQKIPAKDVIFRDLAPEAASCVRPVNAS